MWAATNALEGKLYAFPYLERVSLEIHVERSWEISLGGRREGWLKRRRVMLDWR